MEATFEGNLPGPGLANPRHKLYALVDFIPSREIFISGRILRGFDGPEVDHKGVQFDDLAVGMEHIDRQLARNVRGYRGYVGINGLLFHHDAGEGGRQLQTCSDVTYTTGRNQGKSSSTGIKSQRFLKSKSGQSWLRQVEGCKITCRIGRNARKLATKKRLRLTHWAGGVFSMVRWRKVALELGLLLCFTQREYHDEMKLTC